VNVYKMVDDVVNAKGDDIIYDNDLSRFHT